MGDRRRAALVTLDSRGQLRNLLAERMHALEHHALIECEIAGQDPGSDLALNPRERGGARKPLPERVETLVRQRVVSSLTGLARTFLGAEIRPNARVAWAARRPCSQPRRSRATVLPASCGRDREGRRRSARRGRGRRTTEVSALLTLLPLGVIFTPEGSLSTKEADMSAIELHSETSRSAGTAGVLVLRRPRNRPSERRRDRRPLRAARVLAAAGRDDAAPRRTETRIKRCTCSRVS